MRNGARSGGLAMAVRIPAASLFLFFAACVPPPAIQPVPIAFSDSTISFLEPDVGGGCRWRVIDPPAGADVVLASVPAACGKLQVSWQSAGAQAVLFPISAVAGDEAFLADAAAGTVTRLPRLPGSYASFTWDDGGEVVLTCAVEQPVPLLARMRAWLTKKPVSLTSTLTSHRLRRGRWQEVPTPDRTAAVTTDDLVQAGTDFPVEWRTTRAERASLPRLDGGRWLGLGEPRGLFYLTVSGSEPFAPLVFRDATNRIVRAEPMSAARQIDVQVHGEFALVSEPNTGAHARLYQGGQGILFSSDLVRDAVLWPRPSPAICPQPPGGCSCDPMANGCEEVLRSRRHYDFIDP